MIGTVVEFPRRFADQLLGAMGNRLCPRRSVDDQRHRRLRESQMLRERFESHALPGSFSSAQSSA